MRNNVALLALVSGALVAVQAASAKPPSTGETIDIRALTCKDLMRENDMNRQIGLSFFQGFLAGRTNNLTVNLTTASNLSDSVMDYCLSNPKSTVMNAFEVAAKQDKQVGSREKAAE